MKKRLLKKLVIASYNDDDELDSEQVMLIAKHLQRIELKEYIRALKQFEQKKQLIVDCSFVPTEKEETLVKDTFPDKNIVFHFKPELLFGVQITDNDIVYNMNLRRTLDGIEDYIEQQYD